MVLSTKKTKNRMIFRKFIIVNVKEIKAMNREIDTKKIISWYDRKKL